MDVGVVLDPRTTTRQTRGRLVPRITTDLIAATHCNRVDVVMLNDASPELSARVILDGRRLACAAAHADHAFRRTTLLRAADLKPWLERCRRIKLAALAR